MTGHVTVSPHSGEGTVEEAGYGSIVGACACHPGQVATLLAQIDSSTMTMTMRCQCTLSISLTHRVCSFVQNFSPHSRVKLNCRAGGPRWMHLRTEQTMLLTQDVLRVNPDRVDCRPGGKPTIYVQNFQGGSDLLSTSRPSETKIISFLKRHQPSPLLR